MASYCLVLAACGSIGMSPSRSEKLSDKEFLETRVILVVVVVLKKSICFCCCRVPLNIEHDGGWKIWKWGREMLGLFHCKTVSLFLRLDPGLRGKKWNWDHLHYSWACSSAASAWTHEKEAFGSYVARWRLMINRESSELEQIVGKQTLAIESNEQCRE